MKLVFIFITSLCFSFSVKDWQTLRTQHRICGSLIGTVPAFPRQNDFQGTVFYVLHFLHIHLFEYVLYTSYYLGLPMALMLEEAVLLVKKGICELIDLPNINSNLSVEQRQEIEAVNKKQV